MKKKTKTRNTKCVRRRERGIREAVKSEIIHTRKRISRFFFFLAFLLSVFVVATMATVAATRWRFEIPTCPPGNRAVNIWNGSGMNVSLPSIIRNVQWFQWRWMHLYCGTRYQPHSDHVISFFSSYRFASGWEREGERNRIMPTYLLLPVSLRIFSSRKQSHWVNGNSNSLTKINIYWMMMIIDSLFSRFVFSFSFFLLLLLPSPRLFCSKKCWLLIPLGCWMIWLDSCSHCIPAFDTNYCNLTSCCSYDVCFYSCAHIAAQAAGSDAM